RTPLIPALGRQRQVVYEFEASLVYRVSSSQGYTEKPCLKKP
ncbi:mCG141931, partial [Mus musculus]